MEHFTTLVTALFGGGLVGGIVSSYATFQIGRSKDRDSRRALMIEKWRAELCVPCKPNPFGAGALEKPKWDFMDQPSFNSLYPYLSTSFISGLEGDYSQPASKDAEDTLNALRMEIHRLETKWKLI